MRFRDEQRLLSVLGAQMSIAVVDLWQADLDGDLVRSFPADFLRSHKLLPIERANSRLRVATCDPYDITAFDDLRLQTGLKIEPVLATESAILHFLLVYLSDPDPGGRQ